MPRTATPVGSKPHRRGRASPTTGTGRPSPVPDAESAVVPEDPEAVVTIAGGDILLPAMVEHLDTPEVVAVLIDVVAFLDDLVIYDLGDTEAARVIREVEPVGYPVRGRHLVYREVAEPIRKGGVVCLGDGVGVELGHLAVLVAEQVHVAPTVEVRGEGQRVAGRADRDRCKLGAVPRQACCIVVLTFDAEDCETLLAWCHSECRDVALDAHSERLVAGVRRRAVEDQHRGVAAGVDNVGDLLGERAHTTLDHSDLSAVTGWDGRVDIARSPDELPLSGDRLALCQPPRVASLACGQIGAVGEVAGLQG